MCGIAGIISTNSSLVNKHQLQTMTDALAHRGPDGEGFWINNQSTAGFGHRRLAVIDLSDEAAQPMHYAGRYTIVYNGEIYNYTELREQLQKLGHTFKTNSDTEVILAAFAQYGKDCLQHFDGMFAFAIWDDTDKKLFCARDRFGEKPFYFYHNLHTFLFASEMKALWATGIEKTVQHYMLLNYLTLGYTSDPTNAAGTFYKNIHKLPPSTFLELQFAEGNDALAIHFKQYWDLDKETIVNGNEKDFIPAFYQLLETSVKRRLRSDVAVGSSLSGGIDSSSIVALINRSDHPAVQKTFSAVFPGFEKDESNYIKSFTENLQVENFTTTPTGEELISDFQKLVYHQEEPFQSSSIYAQYKVYELARQHNVTVILDGQGADEILGGYSNYYHWYWQELVRSGKWEKAKTEINAARKNGIKSPWSWKNYVAAYFPGLAAHQVEKRLIQQQKHHPALTKDFLSNAMYRPSIDKPAIDKLNDILYYSTMIHGLEDLLRYADRNAMAHSREVRLPFLNHELVELIFQMPPALKIKDGFGKYVLRKAMDNVLPQNIVWRKEKIGYEPPQKQWMQQPLVKEMIFESRKTLAAKGVIEAHMVNAPYDSLGAHDARNYDWRYLCAVQTLY